MAVKTMKLTTKILWNSLASCSLRPDNRLVRVFVVHDYSLLAKALSGVSALQPRGRAFPTSNKAAGYLLCTDFVKPYV